METEEEKKELEPKPPEPPHARLIMSPKALVVKSNKLVEARQRLSIQEQRLIFPDMSRSIGRQEGISREVYGGFPCDRGQ